MITHVKASVIALSAALCLGVATPAAAESEMPIDEYSSSIAKAKSNMMADPASALSFAREAEAQVKNEADSAAMQRLTAKWLEAEALMRLNRGEEAAGTIEGALAEAAQKYPNDKIYADLLRSAASSKARAGELRDALDHFKLAQERYQALGDARSRAIVLQNIGSLYNQSEDYKQALAYYREASEVYSDAGSLSLSAHNNMGNALKGLGRYEDAEVEFTKALEIAKGMKSPLLEARILTNLASAQHLSGATAKAETTALEALMLAELHANDWKPFVYGVLAQIEHKRGNLDLADDFISRTFKGRPLDKTNALFRDFHEAALNIYGDRGKADLAAEHNAAIERLTSGAKRL
jgi:tetratricopeptide (TPR) repeat protein